MPQTPTDSEAENLQWKLNGERFCGWHMAEAAYALVSSSSGADKIHAKKSIQVVNISELNHLPSRWHDSPPRH